jgi:hypothetical protein
MSSNRATIADEDGDYSDWIELYNSGHTAISLAGYWLSDDPTDPLKWEFPAVTLGPLDYILIFASGKNRTNPDGSYLHTNFRLSAASDHVVLTTPDITIVDHIEIGPLFSNMSYGRMSGRSDWAYFFDSTPGGENNQHGFSEINIGVAKDKSVYINEFMTSNSTSVMDCEGDRPDWIEIYNSSDAERTLTGYWLSDDLNNPFKWRFPEITMAPGEHLLIFASGKDRRDPAAEFLHTNFRLNNDESIVLSTPDGQVIDKIEIRGMITDVSFGRHQADNRAWFYFPAPTPGQRNFTQGFTDLSGKAPPIGHLHINEAMALNSNMLSDEDGDFDDWIELYNSGDAAINLAGFGLSDRPEEPFRWVLPDAIVEPQGFLTVFASGKDRTTPGSPLHTNFSLSASGETLILTAPTGDTVDMLPTGGLASGLSVGRQPDGSAARFLFTKPTPGRSNITTAAHGYARLPTVSHHSGFYQEPITVTLTSSPWDSTDTVIRYTLDGKEPDAKSPIYGEPIRVDRTTVLRARAFVDGYLPGPPINETYFINETTDLTAISIMIDPRDFSDPLTGINSRGPNASDQFPYLGANFWKSWEKPMHFQLFEPDGTLGFRFDAGIRIGGQYSRAMDQKIFNIFARNEYGSSVMEYPFFPDKDLTTFKAITLRTSGQDATMSKLRDTLMTSLLDETSLDYQAYRPTIVFINGQYWGLYNIRERINEYFIAYNHDVDPRKVDILQANTTVRAGSNEHYIAMYNFVTRNDMRRPENYSYIQTQMDIENYIDYWIAMIYFAQTDNVNIRFWREQSDDGLWRWIVYDQDWGFFSLYHNTLWSVTNPEGTGYARGLRTGLLTGLLSNQDFRSVFIERLAYHLNYTFSTERVVSRIDDMAAVIAPEMPRHLGRWGGTMASWQQEVEILRHFARERPRIVLNHIKRHFGLSHQEMLIFNGWPR